MQKCVEAQTARAGNVHLASLRQDAVSCTEAFCQVLPRLTFCMAVGYQRIDKIRHSLTEIWQAGSWTIQKPVNPL